MKNKVMITLRKDLRTAFRDKKSLGMMLSVPLMIPVFIIVFSLLFENIINDTEEMIHNVGINYPTNDVRLELMSQYNIVPVEFDEEEMHDKFQDGTISAYIILRDGVYHIYGNQESQESAMAAMAAASYLDALSNYLGEQYLIDVGIDPEYVFNLVPYVPEFIVGQNDLVDNILFQAFILTIMAMTMTAVTFSTDAVAGEKEKGTLETLLTFPMSGKQLVTGKYIANTIMAIITAVICIVMAVISLNIAVEMFSIYENVEVVFNMTNLGLASIILIGYALFISGVTIAMASFSKTFKEAQSSMNVLQMLPMIVLFMNLFGVEMTEILAAIPIVGHSLLLCELFAGGIDMTHLWIMIASTAICIIFLINYLTRLYKSEKILFSL